MDCPFCGARNKPAINFCGNCGKGLKDQESIEPAAETHKKKLGPIKISLVVLGIILTLLFSSAQFIIEGRIVPAGSMMPTININDRVLISKLSYCIKEPSRGDIIVFQPPASLHATDQYIKRIVGIPGDVIQVTNGKLYVNNKIYQENYISEPMVYEYGPVKVPTNSYFVLGDDRNNSFDSHMWAEIFVPKNNIFGKAVFIYWPSEEWKSI